MTGVGDTRLEEKTTEVDEGKEIKRRDEKDDGKRGSGGRGWEESKVKRRGREGVNKNKTPTCSLVTVTAPTQRHTPCYRGWITGVPGKWMSQRGNEDRIFHRTRRRKSSGT